MKDFLGSTTISCCSPSFSIFFSDSENRNPILSILTHSEEGKSKDIETNPGFLTFSFLLFPISLFDTLHNKKYFSHSYEEKSEEF